MSKSEVKIESGWKAALENEFEQDYFLNIKAYLTKEKNAGKIIFPPGTMIFKAFDLCPFDAVKVVIIGQDPYHNAGEAMGLSFSVPKGKRTPPSLVNIYKELLDDLGIPMAKHGDLTSWSEQGVLLLNAMLTVEENKPSSHRNIGWQTFTDAAIVALSEKREGIVFLLWGNFAKNKASLINTERHLVLNSPHPSPLAGKGFFGNHHFSKTNEYLVKHGKLPIDWQLDE